MVQMNRNRFIDIENRRVVAKGVWERKGRGGEGRGGGGMDLEFGVSRRKII